MSFTVEALAKLRPYLYHLTARENLSRIRRTRSLDSAAGIARLAGREDILGTRRRAHVAVSADGDTIMLRDQAPLHAGNMRLDKGWTFEAFVRHLNERVFFWPGTRTGPISYGIRHYQRYRDEQPAIIRVPFRGLIALNPSNELHVCRFNSGSPRWSRGVAAPRGVLTFVPVKTATFGASAVVEVTFPDLVILPDESSVSTSPTGPWEPLFGPRRA